MTDHKDNPRDDGPIIANLKGDHAIVRALDDRRPVELIVQADADGLTITVEQGAPPARILPFRKTP